MLPISAQDSLDTYNHYAEMMDGNGEPANLTSVKRCAEMVIFAAELGLDVDASKAAIMVPVTRMAAQEEDEEDDRGPSPPRAHQMYEGAANWPEVAPEEQIYRRAAIGPGCTGSRRRNTAAECSPINQSINH